MKNACTSVHWIEGSLRYKLPRLHQKILSQKDRASHHQPVVFLEKRPRYSLPLVAAIEDVTGKEHFSTLLIGDDINKLSADFSYLISDCPAWLNRRAGINCWEFGPKGRSGTITLCKTANIEQLSETVRHNSVHLAGFDTDPASFIKLYEKIQNVSEKITWYPFGMFPREHPFTSKIVVPAIHNKALFLAR
jgi:hypothetical protein